MKLIIETSPKEIADFILAIQSQQKQSEENRQSEIPEKQKKWY